MAGTTNTLTLRDEQSRWMDWATYHRNLFGWRSESEAAMIATWIGFFRRSGFTPEEMMQASDLIARQTEKMWKREDHLSALQTHLHAIRQQKILRQPVKSAEDDQRGTCVYCGDSGAVSVPLLRDVAEGTWNTRRTCAVWCTCWAGRQFHATRNGKGEPMMGLTEYQHRNPLWRRQMEDARTLGAEADLLRTEAAAATGKKGTFDLMRERLMHRWGMLEGSAPERPTLATDGDQRKRGGVDLTAARAAFERGSK